MVRLLVKGGAYMEIKDFIYEVNEECESHELCDKHCIFYQYCNGCSDIRWLIDMIEDFSQALDEKEKRK